jgi:sulfur relay (sulfurtransferase) DsrF/TusC family protein
MKFADMNEWLWLGSSKSRKGLDILLYVTSQGQRITFGFKADGSLSPLEFEHEKEVE